MRAEKRPAILFVVMMAAALLAFSTAAFGYTYEETFEKTIPRAGLTKLSISNVSGEIIVRSWEKQEIRIQAVKKVRASTKEEAEKCAQSLKIKVSERADELKIDTVYPKRDWEDDFWKLFERKPQMSVNYSVYVPKDIDLNLNTISGGIEVSEIEGDVTGRAVSGGVRLSKIHGATKLNTVSGSIHLSEIDGPVDAGAVSGGITADILSAHRCDLHTVSGGISLTLPEDLSADIDAETTSGGIHSDLPITIKGQFDRHRLRGQLNEGGPLIKLRTVSGGVKIKKRRLTQGKAELPKEAPSIVPPLPSTPKPPPAPPALKGEVPIAYCVKTSRPPVIDGVLDDAAWEKARKIEGFVLADGKDLPSEPSEAYLLWDEENLYVSVRCYDSRMDKIKITKIGEDSDVWWDDDVEVFISRDEAPEPYHQFAVNPIGTFFDQLKQSAWGRENYGWSSESRVATSIRAGLWTVEMAIPWWDIGGPPEVGEVRRFNIQRKQQRLREYSYWSPTHHLKDRSWPHIPQRFGKLIFTDIKPEQAVEPQEPYEKGLRCAAIRLEGNSTVPSQEMLNAISIRPGDLLTADALTRVKEEVMALGYFSSVDVSLDKTGDGPNVLVRVKEKAIIRVKEVEIEGSAAFSAEQIRGWFGLRPGNYLQEDIDLWCTLIKRFYHKRGYSGASVSQEYDPTSQVLVITVDEGRIAEIRIRGAKHISEQEIREALGIREGDIYSPSEIKKAISEVKRAIRNLKDVDYEIRPEGLLIIKVKEKDPVHRKVSVSWNFNRVEGLAIGAGLMVESAFKPQGRAYVKGAYGFSRKKWTCEFGAERSWFHRNRLSLGANWHDLVDTQDDWIVSDKEARGLAFWFGLEPRDYFRRQGYEVYLNQQLGGNTLKISYHSDEYESLPKATDWSLFNRGHIKRKNPAIHEGKINSIKVSHTLKSSGNGWLISAEAEMAEEAFGGDFQFRRYQLDIIRHNRLSPDQFFDIRVKGSLADTELPAQRKFQLGGIGTLRGYSYKEFQGDKMLLGQVEYRLETNGTALIPFVDAGYAWDHDQDVKLSDLKYDGGIGLAVGGWRVNWAGAPERRGRWELRFHRTF